jgi:hypothetical protein
LPSWPSGSRTGVGHWQVPAVGVLARGNPAAFVAKARAVWVAAQPAVAGKVARMGLTWLESREGLRARSTLVNSDPLLAVPGRPPPPGATKHRPHLCAQMPLPGGFGRKQPLPPTRSLCVLKDGPRRSSFG